MILENKTFLKVVAIGTILGLFSISCDKKDVNSKPECEITSLVDGDVFVPGEEVLISVNASDKEGELKEVLLYINDALVYTFTEAPYEINWNTWEATLGNYKIEAVAIDKAGAEKAHQVSISLKQGLIYNDQIYDLDLGILEYYGQKGETSYNYDVILYSSSLISNNKGNAIYFELFSSSSADLANGTYKYDNQSTRAPNTFDYSDFILNYDLTTDIGINEIVAEGFTYIEKTGNIYRIFISCITSSNKSITGYYEGILQFSDETAKGKSKLQNKCKCLLIKDRKIATSKNKLNFK